MKSKSKKVPILLLTLIGFVLYLIVNLFEYILLSQISNEAYEIGVVDGNYYYYEIILVISNTTFIGTVAAALIGGSVPGMLTALLIGGLYVLGGDFYYLSVNILIAIVCVLIRNKRILERKRNVPLVALLLTVISYLVFLSDGNAVILALPISFLIFLTELFICRSLIPKFEKYFPIKDSAEEKIYRDHSMKRDILLLMNISAICLSGVFVIFGAVKYYESFYEKKSQYVSIFEEIVTKECKEELDSLGAYGNIEAFSDAALSDVVSKMPTYELYISKIIFYADDPSKDMLDSLGYIEYNYSLEDNDLLISEINKYNTPCDGTYFYNTHSFLYKCINGINIVLDIQLESRDDFLALMLKYIFNLVFISASIIIIANVFAVRLMDKRIVIPINRMTSAAAEFAYDTDEHRAEAMEKFKALDIRSGDEVEKLYDSITKTMADMNDHITNIKEQAKHISDMQHNIILTMADIVESRDENTGGHIRRTAEYVRIIAETLRDKGQYSSILTDEYVDDMIVAAPLHDMGKIHVSDTILNKPGKLSREEYAIMQTHTTAREEICSKMQHALLAPSAI